MVDTATFEHRTIKLDNQRREIFLCLLPILSSNVRSGITCLYKLTVTRFFQTQALIETMIKTTGTDQTLKITVVLKGL